MMIKKMERRLLAAILLFSITTGCGEISLMTSEPPEGASTALLKIVAAPNTPFARIADSAYLKISAADMKSMTVPLKVTDSSVEGSVTNIPAGQNRLFELYVVDSLDSLQYFGSTTVPLPRGTTVNVPIAIYRVGAGAIINGIIHEVPAFDSGLTAYWNFDSSSGNTYYDIAGHGYNALATGNGLKLVPGVLGKALSCPANGFEIEVENSKDSFTFNKFTVEAWFNAAEIPAKGQLKILDFGYIASGVRNGWSFCIVEQGYVDLALSSNDGTSWIENKSTTTLAPLQWYHIAGSYDGSHLRVYVNGVLENIVADSGGVRAAGANARIGCIRLKDGTVFDNANGKIDELKVYNYALPASTIVSHYNALKPIN